mgnify:CR=1 FL=1|tara:strand:- start:11141 stop:13066 length:1926 start_codon:yes stop_codon:yes gene_type:complete
MMQFLTELRRRNVFRVTAAYLVVGWLVMQVISVISDAAALPDWADSLALILLLAGLPVAVFIAWAFEMTPEGLKPTESIDPEASLARATGSTLDIAILAGLGLVAILMLATWFWPANTIGVEPANVVDEISTDAVPDTAVPEPADTETTMPATATPDAPSAQSVAVLPFVAMSSDEEDRYFADGLTEEILNYLAAVPELMVTSRTSAFQFRGDDLPPVPEIARQLGVAHVVEGSVRRSGDRVRVTAQIIRAADDSHLWSQTYDRTMDDVFAIQDDIARNITSVLDIVLDADQLARMSDFGVQNVEAYIAYQRGVEIALAAHVEGADTLAGLLPAEPFFVEAIELAPEFSDAYSQQADRYAHLMNHYIADQSESGVAAYEAAADRYFDLLNSARDTAHDASQRAMIDVDRVYMRESWMGAAGILDRAAQASGCPYSAWIMELTLLSGRAADFIPYAERMTRCDPLSQNNWYSLSLIAYSAGQFDLAQDAANTGLSGNRREVRMGFAKADAMFQLGLREEMSAYMDYLQVPDFIRGVYGAQFAARDGDRAAAVEARRLMGPPDDNGFELVLHAMLGERDAANAMAAQKDAEPGNTDELIFIAARCYCGAPWDLEATPNFARRIAEAEFPWPPPGGENYPLKDW